MNINNNKTVTVPKYRNQKLEEVALLIRLLNSP